MELLLCNIFLLIPCVFIYSFFRTEIFKHCRALKIRKRDIRKKMKGLKNYWFYSLLHKEINLGVFYYLNLVFLILLILFLVLSLLSFVGFLKTPIIVCGIILGTFAIPIGCISLSSSNIESFGKPFVWFRVIKKSDGRRMFVSLLDWFFPFSPLVIYLIFLFY